MTFGAVDGPSALSADLPLLKTANDVRRLSPEEAQRGYPVHLRGVVTYRDVRYHGVFFHDGDTGIYVLLMDGVTAKAGDRVEVVGNSDPGHFAPVVRAARIEVVGSAPLPPPKPVTYAELAAGNEDSQWVEILGLVKSVTPAEAGRIYLDVATGGGRLRCLVGLDGAANADWLVNTTVRIRGVCYCKFNENRQLRAPWLGVTSLQDVRVEHPAASEPVEASISELLRFNSRAVYDQRVKVRGVVTLSQRNGSLFIQDQALGLHVKSLQKTSANPGDIVEAIGFPALGQFKPSLEDVVFRRVGKGEVPPPLELSVEQALNGQHDTELVTIQARLLNRVRRGNEQLLVLKAENSIFNALLEAPDETDSLARLRNGSQVQLTGVCVVQQMENWNPSARTVIESFRILLRSPADIVVLQHPSWWTLSRMLWTVGVLLVVVLAAFAWVAVLRRRVREQTEIIQRKIQREAVLEERARIAREFHDTLEQELVGITMQLDATEAQLDKSPSLARHFLSIARNMSRRSFSEVRRSVWDLRSHFLETGDLPTALGEVARPLAARSGAVVEVAVSGQPRRLPPRIESHLLRIGQEAVSNATKHARAERIIVALHYGPGQVRMHIHDDGRGFDAEAPADAGGGHFGLLDMRERAQKMGCQISLHSRPGQGTDVVVEVNLASLDGEPAGQREDHEKVR